MGRLVCPQISQINAEGKGSGALSALLGLITLQTQGVALGFRWAAPLALDAAIVPRTRGEGRQKTGMHASFERAEFCFSLCGQVC
jgi:hypothetical protein